MRRDSRVVLAACVRYSHPRSDSAICVDWHGFESGLDAWVAEVDGRDVRLRAGPTLPLLTGWKLFALLDLGAVGEGICL